MAKTDRGLIGGQFVLSFEHSDFGIVSDFGFRYSDFMAIPVPVELPKSRTELMKQRTKRMHGIVGAPAVHPVALSGDGVWRTEKSR
jgi:hypothetical protein